MLAALDERVSRSGETGQTPRSMQPSWNGPEKDSSAHAEPTEGFDRRSLTSEAIADSSSSASSLET